MSKKMEECIIPKIKIIERRTIKNNIKIQYYRVINTSTSYGNVSSLLVFNASLLVVMAVPT